MEYEIIISAVHSRMDLLDGTVRSMWPNLDLKPNRIIIHEDVKAAEPYEARVTKSFIEKLGLDLGVRIDLHTRNPGNGLGQAIYKLLSEAKTEFVLYTQEDFDFLRPMPVARCLEIMKAHELHHVRFNKRKTMRTKGADRPPHEQFHKVEVQYDGQTFCISDHWYFQASLWRKDVIKEGFHWLVTHAPSGGFVDRCEMGFNRWYNGGHGRDIHLKDPKLRQERLRTFIWGGIGEPAFIKHTGHDRRSQDWPEAHKRNPNS